MGKDQLEVLVDSFLDVIYDVFFPTIDENIRKKFETNEGGTRSG